MSLKAVMTRAQTAVCTAVLPMSGTPTFDIDKKNRNRANLRLRYALRAGGVTKSIVKNWPNYLFMIPPTLDDLFDDMLLYM